MRVWTLQPKSMADILNNPATTFDVRQTTGNRGESIYTAVALQQRPSGAPLHSALAVCTEAGEAAKFVASVARQVKGGNRPTPVKLQARPAKFTNGVRLQEAA